MNTYLVEASLSVVVIDGKISSVSDLISKCSFIMDKYQGYTNQKEFIMYMYGVSLAAAVFNQTPVTTSYNHSFAGPRSFPFPAPISLRPIEYVFKGQDSTVKPSLIVHFSLKVNHSSRCGPSYYMTILKPIMGSHGISKGDFIEVMEKEYALKLDSIKHNLVLNQK